VTINNRPLGSRTYFRFQWRRSALGLALALGLLSGVLTTACGRFASATPIGQVLSQDAAKGIAAPQTIRGTVVIYAPLLTGSFYQLKDESGSIWVRSSQVVQEGDVVTIEGVPRHQAIQISNREVGEVYFEEQKQLDRQGK
jgi:hypothetical protein